MGAVAFMDDIEVSTRLTAAVISFLLVRLNVARVTVSVVKILASRPPGHMPAEQEIALTVGHYVDIL